MLRMPCFRATSGMGSSSSGTPPGRFCSCRNGVSPCGNSDRDLRRRWTSQLRRGCRTLGARQPPFRAYCGCWPNGRNGRIARLQRSSREGPDYGREPAFQCKRPPARTLRTTLLPTTAYSQHGTGITRDVLLWTKHRPDAIPKAL